VQYDIRITQYGSIKIEQLCKTNPISEKPKMNLTLYSTKDYEHKLPLRTLGKQTQSNPILSASGGFKGQAGEIIFHLTILGDKCRSRKFNQQGWVISLFPLPPLPALFFWVFLDTDKHGLTQIKKQLQLNFKVCSSIFVKIIILLELCKYFW
jgi:hypothetical protein